MIKPRSASLSISATQDILTAGNEARDRRDWDAAARHYLDYLDHKPGAFTIWVQLGHALKESGRLVEALIAYSRALGLNAQDADLWLSFGHLHKRMGHPRDAIAAYQHSFDIDSNPHARSELRDFGIDAESHAPIVTGRRGGSGRGIRFRILKIFYPVFGGGRGQSKKGDEARARGDWEAAANHYARYLQMRPRDFAIWVQLGHALKESKQLDSAVEAYQKAYEIDPKDADLLLNFAHLHKLMGRLDLAVSFYKQSAEQDRDERALDEIRQLRMAEQEDAIMDSDANPDADTSAGGDLGADPDSQANHEADAVSDEVEAGGPDWPKGLEGSALFDAAWYLSRYPDVASSGLNPLSHFILYGAAEGRDPHPLFDSEWYALQYPDITQTGLSPFVDFLTGGAREHRNPNPMFDTSWYLSRNPDVASSGLNPLSHFILYGAAEGRDPHPLFETKWYLQNYPDVASAGDNPLVHFLTQGQAAGFARNSLEFARTQRMRA